MKNKYAIVGIVAVFIAALFFWPTVYEYREMRLKDNVLPVRVNRITGKTEVLYPTGWREINKGGAYYGAGELDSEQLSKLKQSTAFFYEGSFAAEIYNGTELHLTDVNILLVIKRQDGSELERREYRMNCYSAKPCSPFSNNVFSLDLGYAPGTPFEWSIISARGSKN